MRFIPADQLGVARWICAITGRNTDPDGFFDSRHDLKVMGTDNLPREMHYRASVSAAAVKEMARELGWASPQEIDSLRSQAEDLGTQLSEALDRLDKLEQIEKLEAELAEVA